MSSLRIMFVCSGNICRSPMAAGLARHLLEQRGVPHAVISAGTLGINGRSAAAHAVAAMREINVEIDSHYSQGISPKLAEVADYVVVMAPRHERYLRQKVSGIGERIVRLWEWAEEPGLSQIDDPVNQDLLAFRTCRDRLATAVTSWLDEVLASR